MIGKKFPYFSNKRFVNILFILIVAALLTGGILLLKTTKNTTVRSGIAVREKALEFLRVHPNIYSNVYSVNRESYEIYNSMPRGKNLDYEWYKNQTSIIEKDESGNESVSWSGLPGCEQKQTRGRGEFFNESCYRTLKITVLFDKENPISIRIRDLGGVE